MSTSKPLDSSWITIPLHNFKFNHYPFKSYDYYPNNIKENFKENVEFIGRKKQRDKFLGVLNGIIKTSKRGAYLIAGYRGAGKTSFVNKVINDFIKKNNKLNALDVRINLGNETDLSSHQIMSNMVSLLGNEIEKSKSFKWQNFLYKFFILIISFGVFLVSLFFLKRILVDKVTMQCLLEPIMTLEGLFYLIIFLAIMFIFRFFL